MNQQIPFSNPKLDRVMTPEQFNQIVEAILEGKYSWACVLILRFAGYNPLHYIPYRTYNRLTKDNCQTRHRSKQVGMSTDANSPVIHANRLLPQQSASKINDLNYVEAIGSQAGQMRAGGLGGLTQWLDYKLGGHLPFKVSLKGYQEQINVLPREW
ncbi:HetP family heterocyst commitment protein [Stenomitos frigidus]|uniref:HetP family heterocyst commitment protein n=1 Tax=Stenomitos frigidus TaxID=1886765 RepID=UPI0015E64CD9|nr:HetP family heterocyst commitment protein [Stenomitos frigidus]